MILAIYLAGTIHCHIALAAADAAQPEKPDNMDRGICFLASLLWPITIWFAFSKYSNP